MRISDWSSAVCSSDLIGWDKSAKKAAWAHLSGLFGAWVGQLLPEHEDKLTDYALDFARRSQSVTLKDFLDGMTIEGEMYKSLGKILQKHNLLLRSEEHTSELQSLMRISYAVF